MVVLYNKNWDLTVKNITLEPSSILFHILYVQVFLVNNTRCQFTITKRPFPKGIHAFYPHFPYQLHSIFFVLLFVTLNLCEAQ